MPIKDLSLLKAQRFSSLEEGQRRLSLYTRVVNCYKRFFIVNAQKYSKPIAFIYTFIQMLTKAGGKLKKILYSLQKNKSQPVSMTYAVHIVGGIGDAIMAARFVRDFQTGLDKSIPFDIYFYAPTIVEPFFRNIPGFRQCMNAKQFEDEVSSYAFALLASQYAEFYQDYIHPDLLQDCPVLQNFLEHTQLTQKNMGTCFKYRPLLDWAYADKMAPLGKKRNTNLHEMMGLTYGGDRLTLDIDPSICYTFDLIPNQYVTLHDGWDNNLPMYAERATKAVPLQKWIEIVRLLKEARPDLKIVQLGAKTGSIIPGIDICLKEKLTFLQSTSIMASGLLHIDNESGLVHLATAIGIRSVVMFGPTNLDWFGYPQNANISPKQCGDCWRVTKDWMDKCPIGYEQPICTASINPAEVVEIALKLLPEATA